MRNGLESTPRLLAPGEVFPTAARITIGSYVCLAEGTVASIGPLVGRTHWLFVAALVLSICFWAGAERFRHFSKVGADISDLFFYEAIGWSIALACYLFGYHPWGIDYFSHGLTLLKLIRLYMWQGTNTYEQGWGIFGPMSYLHAKKNGGISAACKPIMYRPLLVAICVATGGSVWLKGAAEPVLVAVAWLLPLGFELIFGPRQLASLAQFVPAFLAGNKREEDQATEIAALKQAIATLSGTGPESVPPELLARFIAAYNNTKPILRPHLVDYAEAVGNACVEEAAEKAAKAKASGKP